MLSIRNVLAASLLFLTFASYVTCETPDSPRDNERDMETFQKLLSEVDPPALHEALHSISPKKYKHGAFPEDRTAVEVIHKEEPSVATSIVNLARRQAIEVVDLSKRQAGDISNGTTPTTTPASPNPQTSTRVTPVPPISEPSTTAPGSTTEPSTSLAEVSTPSTTPSVASTLTSAPSPSSTTAATSAETSSSPTPSTTSSPISLTAGQVITTTNAVGLTIISTVGGGATTISPTKKVPTTTDTHNAAAPTSVVVQTSTLPNGSKSVVTAVTVVGEGNGAADTPTGTAGVGATSTGSSPGLQTGEAVMSRSWGKEMVLVVGGAVAFAGMM